MARKNEVTQQEYEDSEKNTKIGSDDEKNREEQSQQQAEEQSQPQAEEQSQQQAEEQSQQQAGRAKPRAGKTRAEPTAGKANQRTANRDKAKYEEKHTTEDGGSQPVPDVQQGQYELKLDEGIATIPKIDFDEETVAVQERELSRPLRSSDTESPEDRDGFLSA